MDRVIRHQKTTVFGFGEGETEKVFLKYLMSLYADGKTSITISSAGGKDVSHIIAKAVRVRGEISYKHSFILLDMDISWPISACKTAKTKGIELVGNNPCIEGLFLEILEPRINHSTWLSSKCKNVFKNKYLKAERILNNNDCKKLFPKLVLEGRKVSISSLLRIITIFEGDFS